MGLSDDWQIVENLIDICDRPLLSADKRLDLPKYPKNWM